MRILSHYFVARFLGLFATVLVAALLLLATVELVLHFDQMTAFTAEPQQGPFRYLWVRLASYYLADVLPIASFVAVFVAFAWAGRAMELVAIEAGGIRLLRVILPVLATALILSCATAILHETLVLRAEQIWRAEEREERTEIDFGRRAFWYQRGRVITNIEEADPTTRTLRGVEIFERGPTGSIVRVIRADRVRIGEDGIWAIEDASVWSFSAEDPTRPPRIETGVALDLDLDTLRGDALLGADPGLLPLPILARYLEESPERMTPSHRRRLGRRLHERLSSPWLVLTFAWLALPFGLQVDRSGRIARPALLGVAAVAGFFLVRSVGTALAQESLLPVGLTPWLTIGLFAAGAAWLLRRQSI